jgi:hypothetical protein
VAQQSVTKFTEIIVMTLVTPKAAAKHELLFNKPTSESGHTLLCYLKLYSIGKIFLKNHLQQQHATVTTILALASFDKVT